LPNCIDNFVDRNRAITVVIGGATEFEVGCTQYDVHGTNHFVYRYRAVTVTVASTR
jgi:hypothetical protein